jgi:hypothetical protein
MWTSSICLTFSVNEAIPLPGSEWLTKPRGATCSWPLIRCPAGDAKHHREGGDPLGLHPHLQLQDRRECPPIVSRDLERACPMRIRTILTPSHGLQANHCRAMDNGKEFTDRLFGLRKRTATGKHEFDQLCGDLGIEHRLAPR